MRSTSRSVSESTGIPGLHEPFLACVAVAAGSEDSYGISAQLASRQERGLQAASPSSLSRRSRISPSPWDCATRKRR